MRNLILAVLVFICGCATPHPYEKLGSKLAEIRPEISDAYSFSFLYKGDKYFFAPKYFTQGDRDCYLFLGFKNEILTYAFPQDVFKDIEKAYRDNDSPTTIKKLILERISDERATPTSCSDLGYKHFSPPDSGQAALLVLAPIVLPFLVPEVINRIEDQNLHQKISEKIQLGMAKEKVPSFITRDWLERKKGKYTYFEFQRRKLRMIFYFEDSKLDAWSQSDQ
jgi:hypothetical protein